MTVRVGDIVVDATVGNGHDTELLARLIGRSGRVYGFDIQRAALESTSARLAATGLASRVRLSLRGHERMFDDLPQTVAGDASCACIMFNLGYLPGGDKRTTTKPETTVVALSCSCNRLAPSGLLSIVVYLGHPGAETESRRVDEFVSGLSPSRFSARRVAAHEIDLRAAYAWHIRRHTIISDREATPVGDGIIRKPPPLRNETKSDDQ